MYYLGHKKLFLLSLLPLILVACFQQTEEAADSPSDYQIISTPSFDPAQPFPAATGEVLLQVGGSIGLSNVAGAEEKTVEFDLALLESLGLVEYRALDTQGIGGEAVFQGLLLSRLLEVVQAASGASELYIEAFDAYQVSIPLSDLERFPVLLALKQDGAYLTLENFGPLRVVYPNIAYTEIDVLYDPKWIWSVVEITVR
jgi:hypothetical protein